MEACTGRTDVLRRHKANFPMAPSFLRRGEEEILNLKTKRSPLIAGYDCPPGSAIFFAEATCQCAQPCLPFLFCCTQPHPMTRAVLCRAMLCCAAAGMVGMHACMQCGTAVAGRPPTHLRAAPVRARRNKLPRAAGDVRSEYTGRAAARAAGVLSAAPWQSRGGHRGGFHCGPGHVMYVCMCAAGFPRCAIHTSHIL